MPLRLALIKTDSSQSGPKPHQNAPGDVGDLLCNSPSFPTLIQDVPTLVRAPDVHADLQAVITAWPMLSEAVRATILRLIEEGEV